MEKTTSSIVEDDVNEIPKKRRGGVKQRLEEDWAIQRQRDSYKYLVGRSRNRRWRPTDGEEWPGLAECGDWAQGRVALRLYLNGLPNTARDRRREDDPHTQLHPPTHKHEILSILHGANVGRRRPTATMLLNPTPGVKRKTLKGRS